MTPVVCLVQARIHSTRLKGKVLLPILNDLNSLDLIYRRLSNASMLDDLLFTIPSCVSEKPLGDFLDRRCYNYSAGATTDLVDRYISSLSHYDNCIIVRVTSDCPLVDAAVVDEAVKRYLHTSADYCSNYTPANKATYCNGSDVEVFSLDLLKNLKQVYTDRRDREHVTFPLWDGRMPNIQHELLMVKDGLSYSDVRITLDYTEDLEVLRQILTALGDIHAPLRDIVTVYRDHGLSRLNGHHHYSEGWL